ncbi:hypothetical protein FKM82_008524 [Ascaphus truei]
MLEVGSAEMHSHCPQNKKTYSYSPLDLRSAWCHWHAACTSGISPRSLAHLHSASAVFSWKLRFSGRKERLKGGRMEEKERKRHGPMLT